MTQFSKDLTNPTNPHESLVLKTIESVRIRDFQIREYLRCSKDSFCGFVLSYSVQKIHFVDSFRDAIFKRFVSWIRFVRKKSQKGLFRIHLEGFMYKSRILTQYALKTIPMGQ
jgi:hypothetical protein